MFNELSACDIFKQKPSRGHMSSLKILSIILIALNIIICKVYSSPSVEEIEPTNKIISLPKSLPKPDGQGVIHLPIDDYKRPLTINYEIQKRLENYIKIHGNPIAAVVIVDVRSGHILSLAQGKKPEKWGSLTHTALYEGFPAASLFKIVPALAALDFGDIESDSIFGIRGGCSKVHPSGIWLRDVKPTRYHKMTLSRAFANSCNSFFAKLTLQYLGVGILNSYAKKLGWDGKIPTDFELKSSPLNFPTPSRSALHTVGRYAAGFGMVGLSPVHAAWINLLIARDGDPVSIKIFADKDHDTLLNNSLNVDHWSLDDQTTYNLRQIMKGTVRYGTAASAFRPWKYRKIRKIAGGKTGTLTSKAPKGKATWFAGLMPIEKPEVVISAIVLNGNRWVIKGSHLAAEGLRLWEKYRFSNKKIETSSNIKIP